MVSPNLIQHVHVFVRGLFIIDGKGILRQITMNDLPVGRSVDETLRLVQAFQYTDKHGEGTESAFHSLSEKLFIFWLQWNPFLNRHRVCSAFFIYLFIFFPTVCPAGWKPGSDTVSMTGNWTDSLSWIVLLNKMHHRKPDFDQFKRMFLKFKHLSFLGINWWSKMLGVFEKKKKSLIKLYLPPQIIPDPSGKLKYFDKLNWTTFLLSLPNFLIPTKFK